MQSVKIDIFFSCSFAEEDKEINNYFLSICKAIDLQCVNVSTAYAETPPEKAKELIGNSLALIAICTKRTDFGSGNYAMPEAVHDELSFAFGKDIPVLMLVEEGIQLLGFKNNFGTHLKFNRDKIYNTEFLHKAVQAIHELKLKIISHDDIIPDQDISEFYAEYIHHAVEMIEANNDYSWRYSSTKKLRFNKPYKKSFTTGVWATLPPNIPDNEPAIQWELRTESSSRNISVQTKMIKESPQCIEASLKFDPPAESGDFIEYSITSSSRYLNPVWSNDVAGSSSIHLESGSYECVDGIIATQRTKKAIIEFRFPKSYGLKQADIYPFVASYTSGVDYEVESEIKRLNISSNIFAGILSIRIEIDSPLVRHMYGIAWNPKTKPAIPILE